MAELISAFLHFSKAPAVWKNCYKNCPVLNPSNWTANLFVLIRLVKVLVTRRTFLLCYVPRYVIGPRFIQTHHKRVKFLFQVFTIIDSPVCLNPGAADVSEMLNFWVSIGGRDLFVSWATPTLRTNTPLRRGESSRYLPKHHIYYALTFRKLASHI